MVKKLSTLVMKVDLLQISKKIKKVLIYSWKQLLSLAILEKFNLVWMLLLVNFMFMIIKVMILILKTLPIMTVACKLVDQNYKICTKDLLITTQWFLLKTHLIKMILKTTLK